MTALDRQGPTSVRTTGDDYQWRHVWGACLEMLLDDATGRTANSVVAVGVEVDDAGNVDDLVRYRKTPPHRYTQVKWSVDWSTPLGLQWLGRTKKGSTSVLAKLAASRRTLVAKGEPFEMSLLTNRAPQHDDILVSGRDARTGLLTPKAAENGPKSRKGEVRAEWAKAAGIDESELLELLGVLELEYAHDSRHTNAALSNAMAYAGLRCDENAVQAGADWVAKQVRESRRHLTVDDVTAGVEKLNLRAGRAWRTVSIATLKPDPLAEGAQAALDWVDRFGGADEWTKRQPLAPATWDELAADIAALPDKARNTDGILVTGSLRQATGFAVGAAFRRVAGFDVAIQQSGQLWHSEARYRAVVEPKVTQVETFELGEGLAVVVQVARPALGAVRDWITRTKLPVKSLVALEPPGGRSDQAFDDAASAIAFAVAVRDTVTDLARKHDRVHLFLCGPLGLAILMGHRWNRVAPTTVYEDLTSDVYTAAFDISA
jgi:hypothetical protein